MAQAKDSVRLSVDVPRDLYDELVAFAKEERSSKARIILVATAFYLRYAASQMAFGRAENFAEQILSEARKAKQEKEKSDSPEETKPK
ncbi:MAG: hypothetical protein WCC18_19105 [Candidatus Acidiferrales bacterium]